MADKVFFGAIHIIEWFGADERVHTAWELFNELEPIGIMYKPEKAAVLPKRKLFSLISAHMAFEMVMAEYRDTQHADDVIEARLDKIEVAGAAEGMNEQQRLYARSMARA
jgi:hypothetical protein